jgi:hypothetical protein
MWWERQGVVMKYEHARHILSESVIEDHEEVLLSERGEDGWGLVSVVGYTIADVALRDYYFKRELPYGLVTREDEEIKNQLATERLDRIRKGLDLVLKNAL